MILQANVRPTTKSMSPVTDDNTVSDEKKFSCNECKRRRIKCSRQLPVCELCSKYKRHCLYEKHIKTPLTRKYLTEVEEELQLAKKILCYYFPDINLNQIMQKLKNGNEIYDIPEVRSLGYSFRKRYRDVSEEEVTINETQSNSPKKRPTIKSAEKNLPTSNDMSSMNLQFMLTENDSIGKEEISNDFDNDKNIVALQIPQILPSSIIPSSKEAPNNETLRKKKRNKRTNKSSYNWDERSNNYSNPHATIIDGMATEYEHGYLGAASSAALINLVGGGFFLHENIDPINRKSKKDPSSVKDSSLNEIKNMVSKENLEIYINQYFETFHISYPIIHKPVFLAQFNEIIPTPPLGWESLLHIVAAIGAFMSATSPDDNDDLILFEIAKSKLSIDLLETGNITLVQTLTLISNYLQKRDMPNSGYNYLGLAVRMALGLGLHKEIDDFDESLLNQEVRRRVWWCLYIFDCGQTITYGRPLGIPCAGIDVKLPLNILDSSLTALTVNDPEECDHYTVYSSVRLQSLFHLLSNSIYERIITDPFPTAKLLLEWDNTYLDQWKKSIPTYFQKQADVSSKFKLAHSVLDWRFRNLKIIMYRTFLLKKVIVNPKMNQKNSICEFEVKAGDICLEECIATIQSMSNYWQMKTAYNRMDAWYSLFFLIPAVLMPLVCLRNDPTSHNAVIWTLNISLAQSIIRSIMNICPTASKILELIESLGSGYLANNINDNSVIEFATAGTDESPLSQLMQLHGMLWPVSFDIEQQFLNNEF